MKHILHGGVTGMESIHNGIYGLREFSIFKLEKLGWILEGSLTNKMISTLNECKFSYL